MSKMQFLGGQAQFKPVVKGLQLQNFRGFLNLDISLQEDLTVFISRNGGGKSTILDAIWSGLEVIEEFFRVGRHSKQIGWLETADIKNGTGGCSLSVDMALHFQWPQKEEEVEEKGLKGNTLEDGKKEFTIRVNGNQAGFDLVSKLSAGWPELSEYLEHGAQQEDSRPIFKYYQAQGHKPEFPVERKLAKLIDWIDRRQKVLMQSTNKRFEWQLDWVKQALSNLLSDDEVTYTDLKVKYAEEGSDSLSITKRQGEQAEELSARQLSSGEISLMEIVADLAISLIEANPNHREDFNPLTNGFGVVLIDEVGMHLHPGWQRNVLPKLQKGFPGLQFVVSTHSPLILSRINKEQGRVIKDFQTYPVGPVEGRDASSILEDEFGESERPKEYEDRLKHFYELLERNRDQAESLLRELKEVWGEKDEEIIRAESYLEVF